MGPVILHIDLHNQSILTWLNNNKFIIYCELVRYAEKLIRSEELDEIQAIIIANLAENVVFILKKKDIQMTLAKANRFFLSIEEYEQCAKIRDLFILIEEMNKSRKNER